MEVALETTQLIFIHNDAIDIRFRNDERRFDAEGSYNIRYHIVKKRIDKILVKGTSERLTQPRKIAMVYSDKNVADQYDATSASYRKSIFYMMKLSTWKRVSLRTCIYLLKRKKKKIFKSEKKAIAVN